MAAPIVGRARELGAIEGLVASLTGGPAALVLEGEAGIGKTSLLRAGIEAATAAGARVLICAGSQADSRLAYAGLADLLEPVDPAALGDLPRPQRGALDAALLRSSPSRDGVDQRAVSAALLNLLGRLSQQQPVLLAIDDAQWLDQPTARAIDFCARRIKGPVSMLVTRRAAEAAGQLSARLGFEGVALPEIVRVGPLEGQDIELMLRERTTGTLDRRAIARVREVAGGNPFFAIELGRAVAEGAPTDPLTLPSSLDEVVAERTAGLTAETAEALLAVAALAEPSRAVLEQALGPSAWGRLEAAEERGLVEIGPRTVAFTHPLLADGVYSRAAPRERREMHGRLATAVSEPEERARHLAHAGDPGALAALDDAAMQARIRGAPDAAAELLELALQLGGGPELRLRLAEHRLDAGETQRARDLLEAVVPELEGTRRVEALLLLGELRYKSDSFPESRRVFEEAQAAAGDDDRLQAMIGLRLAFILYNLVEVEAAAAAAGDARERAERLGHPGLIGQTLAVTTILDFALGLGFDEPRLLRAIELQDPEERTSAEFYPSLIASFIYMWNSRFDEAREALDLISGIYAARGEEQALAWAEFTRVWIETWAGDLVAAQRAGEEAYERLTLLETLSGRALALAARAQVDAITGRVEEARQGCAAALELFDETGWIAWAWFPRMTLGGLALALEDPAGAHDVLAPMIDVALAAGLPDPAPAGILFVGDAAEALIGVGRLAEAEELIELVERRGRELDRAWAIAIGGRCRALLHGARDDPAAGERVLEETLLVHARVPMPVEHGRTLLALGRMRRRLRKRRLAREVLEEAVELFEGMGTPLWAAQARGEIACLGLQPSAARDELTASERRVAGLAASGLTNREVAASLIISPKTVEAHLARAYRKLGIRSRAELGARLGGEAT